MERPMFSEELSTRRRQLGFSTAQASRVLRLKEDVLIAFEEGDFEAMPKSGYAQGMLSSYARYLGLDAARIVEMYVEELEEWRRGGSGTYQGRDASHAREVRSAGVGQPYVAARGLLPTSGGPAGDMGSFATTRVHARRNESSSGEGHGYGTQGYGQAYSTDAQSRPYTGRSPERRSYRESDVRTGRRDIQMRDYGVRGFEDDLRIGMDAQSYEAASSGSGRRSSRGMSSRERRQRVRTRPTNGRRSSRSQSRGGARRREQSTSRQAIVIIVVAIVVISVFLVNMISSCYNRNFNTQTSHPVSTATVSNETSSKSGSNASSATQTSSRDVSSNDTDDTTNSNGKSSNSNSTDESTKSRNGSSAKVISVSVSVAEGAVTWLEIECDGSSEVAEQLTGPWNHTYEFEESFSVQANDTSAVTVEQDGKQLQFEPMTSGVGVIRIQGTKKPSESSNASETAKKKKAENGESDESSSASSSSSGSSARMGGDSSDENTSSSATSKSKNSSKTDDEEYDEYSY